jgi:multiple sugar transport system permease protein
MALTLRQGVFYILITIGAIIVVTPVIWMFSASFMTKEDVLATPINLIPPKWRFVNYVEIFTGFNIGHYFINSVIVTTAVVLLNLLFSSLVGYSLAKFDYPGKNLIFLFILATIIVPFNVIVVPLYVIVRSFGWINSLQALIVPNAMTAFGIFLMRQFIIDVPGDYMDAARIDGASEFGIFLRIVAPLCKPALTTLAIITFVSDWDSFLWPLIVLTTDRFKTLPLGLAKFRDQYSTQWHLLMAAAVVAVLPVLTLFMVMQRRFITGMSGLAGLKA